MECSKSNWLGERENMRKPGKTVLNRIIFYILYLTGYGYGGGAGVLSMDDGTGYIVSESSNLWTTLTREKKLGNQTWYDSGGRRSAWFFISFRGNAEKRPHISSVAAIILSKRNVGFLLFPLNINRSKCICNNFWMAHYKQHIIVCKFLILVKKSIHSVYCSFNS